MPDEFVYEIEVTGLQELISKLEASTRERVIMASLEQGGHLLSGWSKKNRLTGPRPQYLGVRTGRLRSSIAAGKPFHKGNEYTEKIGTNVKYGPIHEFGGLTGRNRRVFMPARPFLRPAIQDGTNQKELLNLLVMNITEELNKK